MKFSALAIGQRFRFQGGEYTKTSPLMAEACAGGERRLLPRSAEVAPLDNSAAASGELPTPPSEVPLEQLDRVMQQLAGELNEIIAESGLNAAQSSELARLLQAAFVRARQALQLPT